MKETATNSLSILHKYCLKSNYKGWDLFDGLNSRIFKKSPFYNSRFCRLAWIQFFKRSPLNFRRILSVPEEYNAKGISLFTTGLILMEKYNEAKPLIDLLEDMKCNGYSGISWGYNFDWQARAFYAPEGTPNIVTTVFVGNALLDYYENTRDKKYLNIAQSSCDFLLDNLVISEDDNSLCFGYIPGEQAKVHNANMLGGAFLSRVYAFTKNKVYLEKSRKSMFYSIRALNDDYSWPYGERLHHKFIDNFHTGFSLCALKSWIEYTGDRCWEDKLKKAYQYFLDTFWEDNGCPKYYSNSLYPIDIHCSAQGIVTCIKLQELNERSMELANKIARWAIDNMQNKEGYFYYQKTKWYTNKIPYIRWSQAWMFYGLSNLLSFNLRKSV